jgi:hypothetical protein
MCAKWWCEEGRVYVGIVGSEMCGEQGGLLLGTTRQKRGSIGVNGIIPLAVKPQWVCTS